MIGIDLVCVSRLHSVMERTPRFQTRVFSQQEIADCEARANPYPSYAARFGVKEAFRKLDPVFLTGIRFQEVEVVSDPTGRPGIRLSGNALRLAQAAGIGQIFVSLSHDGDYAVAALTAERCHQA
ncbi:MAG: holo-ACP synthase [Solirubrobacterales bacterium]